MCVTKRMGQEIIIASKGEYVVENRISGEHHGAKRLENLSTPSNEVLSGFTTGRWGGWEGGKREERWKHAGGGNRISWQVDLPRSKVLGFVGVFVFYACFHAFQQCLRENSCHSIVGEWNCDNRTRTHVFRSLTFLSEQHNDKLSSA